MNNFRSLRRKLFVSQEIQGRLLGRLALYWIGYHAFLWHAMFVTEWINLQLQNLNAGSAPAFFPSYWEFLKNNQLLPMVAAAIFPVVVWDMLKFSHRVAGPLVQLRNRLRSMAMGNPPEKLRMRQHDMLVEIQTAFNEYIETLQSGKSLPATGDLSQPKSTSDDDPIERLLAQVQALQEMSKDIDNQPTPVPTTTSNESPAV